jgi:hypothetical protein
MIRPTGPAWSAALLLATAALAASAEQDPEWLDTARGAASGLGSELVAELQAAMAEGGPVNGIDTCRVRAPQIAKQKSDEAAAESRYPIVDVGRTALRTRNPANRPDSWQTEVLEDFRQRMADGDAPTSLQAWTVAEIGERRVGRWMKAIPTQPICLTCHGSDLGEDVAAAIETAYPDDRATGFSAGELRGAFTVDIDLGPR